MDFSKLHSTVKKHVLKSYIKRKDNLLLAQKLFIVNSALNKIFTNFKDLNEIKVHLYEIEKYLRGETDISGIKNILNKESRAINENKTKKTNTKPSGSK